MISQRHHRDITPQTSELKEAFGAYHLTNVENMAQAVKRPIVTELIHGRARNRIQVVCLSSQVNFFRDPESNSATPSATSLHHTPHP